MLILGLHGGFTINQHDAAACLISDGKIAVAIEEERVSRVKSPRGVMPTNAIRYCLGCTGIKIEQIDRVAISGDTYGKSFRDKLSNYLLHWFGYAPEIDIINHQRAHIYSSWAFMGLNQSQDISNYCFISSDAYGDSLSSSIYTFDKSLTPACHHTNNSSNSLGMFYSAITSICGFRPSLDEYKLMGLAPYGSTLDSGLTKQMEIYFSQYVKSDDAQGYIIDNSILNSSIATTDEPFYNVCSDLRSKARLWGNDFDSKSIAIAFAAQTIFEKALTSYLLLAYKLTGKRNYILTGGAALNCAATLALRNLEFVDELQIPPCASDRGLAIGSAVGCLVANTNQFPMTDSPYLGKSYGIADVKEILELLQISFVELPDPEKHAAKLLSQGFVIGWFQGKAETGARALGNRSILASPLISDMKAIVNKKIKFREGYRPFAPSVTAEDADKYFMGCTSDTSPYMTHVFKVRNEYLDKLPSVTHIDETARVHTVTSAKNPVFYKLLKSFESITGVPVLLNTSFNIADQPIVETPREAISVYFSTGLDYLFIGNLLISKT
jgi:carbamoyltransferase